MSMIELGKRREMEYKSGSRWKGYMKFFKEISSYSQ